MGAGGGAEKCKHKRDEFIRLFRSLEEDVPCGELSGLLSQDQVLALPAEIIFVFFKIMWNTKYAVWIKSEFLK